MKNIYISRIDGGVVLSPSILTFNIEVEDSFDASKIVNVEDGTIQKTNSQEQLLYKIKVQEDGTYEETTENITVTKYEEKQVINKWFDENGVEHSETVIVQEPIEWIDNEKVMVPNMVKKTITFVEGPTKFTALEILNHKYNSLLDNTPFDFVQAGIFLNEDNIDLTDIKANTGIAILELLPHGYAKSKVLTLHDSVTTFRLLEFINEGVELYINGIKFTNNVIKLDIAVSQIILEFKNTTDKFIDVKSYAIAY